MPPKLSYFVISTVLITLGCATPSPLWHSMPAVAEIENPFYRAILEPEMGENGLFVAFQLEITNKSSQILWLDWNESAYLFQGNTSGPMVFLGISPEKVKMGEVPLEEIAPGKTISKKIGPLKLISIRPGRHGADDMKKSQIAFGPFPTGYNGIQLVIRCTDKAIVEDLQTRIFQQ